MKKRSSFNRMTEARPVDWEPAVAGKRKPPTSQGADRGVIGNGLFRVFYDQGYLYAFDSGLSVFHGVSL